MTRRIRLTNGRYALVSDHKYEELRRFVWIDKGTGVIRNCGYHPNGSHKTVSMHRQILGIAKGSKSVVDHINGNVRDNRDENLRECSQTENSRNNKKSKNNKTGYKGVYWSAVDGSFASEIGVNRKHIPLGTFDDPKIAGYAYDNAARKYFGEFAKTNFSDVMPEEEVEKYRRTRKSPRSGRVKLTRSVYCETRERKNRQGKP